MQTKKAWLRYDGVIDVITCMLLLDQVTCTSCRYNFVHEMLTFCMHQEQLESLMLASVEKNILQQLSVDDQVAKFASVADRRMELA
jgi:hypothetical protein